MGPGSVQDHRLKELLDILAGARERAAPEYEAAIAVRGLDSRLRAAERRLRSRNSQADPMLGGDVRPAATGEQA